METMDELLALTLFNEKAALLRDSAFVKQASHPDAGINFSFGQENPMAITHIGPDEAVVREFVVTLRFFIQENERCSISRVAKIYEFLPVSAEEKKAFAECRTALNGFLDRPSHIVLGTSPMTHRRIMEVFVYGNIAHANPEKEHVLASWKATPGLYLVMYDTFVYVIGEMLRAIGYIFRINEEVLRDLAHLVPERKFAKPLP